MEAAIFDLDGTLIDSIPLFLVAYEKAIRGGLGVEPPKDAIRRQFGKSSKGIIAGVLEEMDIELGEEDREAILADIRRDFAERVRSIAPLPGACELLKKLDGSCKVGLATSSRRYYTDRILNNLGLSDYFDAIATADDVERAKPAPDVFLKAAERLGARPAGCVVFEDAAYGVMAARAAGMRVVAVTTGSSTREELEAVKPDAIVDSLSRVDIEYLRKVGGSGSPKEA